MSASFPTAVRSLAVPAAGDELLYTDVADMSEEVTAMLTAFVNGSARCSAYHNTTQSLTSGVATALSLNSEDFDVGAMHDLVTNNSRVTVPTGGGGVYLAIAGTSFAANATGYRAVKLKKNNTTNLANVIAPVSSAGIQTDLIISAFVSLAAADYLELIATQTSGGGLNAGSATREESTFLQLVRVW